MLRLAIYTAVFVGGVLGQTVQRSAAVSDAMTGISSSAAQSVAESAALASDDPVLLIHGVCGHAKHVPLKADDCTVAISRRQFECVMNILSPGVRVSPGVMNRIATTYAELLAFDRAARELEMDNSLEYQETVRWLQVNALADLLHRRLEKESGTVSDAEIEAYYREQLPQFEEVKLQRLVLPKNNFAVDGQQKFEHDAQRIAAELRERAADGEDLERLQKEGYAALGFSGAPPVTDVGNRRKANVPSEVRDEVFSLRPGEVSNVKNETYSFVIYKVEARRRIPEKEIREEITRDVAKEKLERAVKAIIGNIRTELNEKYFGTASAR